jgi:anti-sigma B factor antagonist
MGDGVSSLDIGVLKHGDVTSLTLRGPLVLGPSVDSLRSNLDNLVAHGESRIVLDIAGINRLDSSGIGLLVKALQSTKAAGGTVKLVNPPKVVLQTLTMCRLLPLFEVYESGDAAIASFA